MTNRTENGQNMPETEKKGGLTPEEKMMLEKLKMPINITNGFRILFTVSSLVILIVIFGISKKADASWFEKVNLFLYELLIWNIVFTVLTTIAKFVFVVRYNKFVKKL